MKKIILIWVFASCMLACKTITINAWDSPNRACGIYQVTEITKGENGIYPGISEDSISIFYVTISRKIKYARVNGPDYCLLALIDEKGDTIAKSAINGLPTSNRSRTYPVFSSKIIETIPDIRSIKISLPPYCDYMNEKLQNVFIDR